MVRKLTRDEEASLERASSIVANRIVSNCSSKTKDIQGIEACVASRATGLQYIEDIIGELPEDHALKIDDEQIHNMTDLVKREALSYLK